MIHAAAMMKHCLNSCLKKTLQSGVSVSRSSPVRNESVVVTWEQLSDVWLDKRKLGARCDSALMSVLWVSTTPSRGSTAYSLSGPLCCEWQWSRLLREARVHARAHDLNPGTVTERRHEQNAVSWFKTIILKVSCFSQLHKNNQLLQIITTKHLKKLGGDLI